MPFFSVQKWINESPNVNASNVLQLKFMSAYSIYIDRVDARWYFQIELFRNSDFMSAGKNHYFVCIFMKNSLHFFV